MNLKRRQGSANTASALILCGTIGGSLVLGAVLPGSRISESWAVVLVNLSLVLVPFGRGAFQRRIDVFDPSVLFAVSFAVLFVIRPIFDLSTEGGPAALMGRPTEPGYTKALLVATAGALTFYVGYYSKISKRIASLIPHPSAEWYSSTLTLGVAVIAAVSILLTAIMISQVGGIGPFIQFLSGRGPQRRSYISQSTGYLYTAPLLLYSVAILYMATAPRRLGSKFSIGVLLLALSQITTLGSGDRSWFLPALVSAAVVIYLRKGTRPSIRTIGIALAVGFIVLITVPREIRNTEAVERGFVQTITESIQHPGEAIGGFFQGLDTAMIEVLALEVQSVPQQIDYQYGQTYLDDLARPIPKTLWESKPRSGDEQLMSWILPELYNQGVQFYTSVFGEPYLNFGLFGVACFGLMFGAGWSALYHWFCAAPSNQLVMTIYALSYPFLFVYMRGGVGVDYQRHLIALLPALLIVFVAQRRNRSAPLGSTVGEYSPGFQRNVRSAGLPEHTGL